LLTGGEPSACFKLCLAAAAGGETLGCGSVCAECGPYLFFTADSLFACHLRLEQSLFNLDGSET
jgi:hypothetical protein